MQKKSLQIKSLKLTSPVILAPMAGISNLPYRRIMKSFGAGLVYTEMVSANGMIREGKKTRQLLESHASEFPLGIQLFGDDPEVLGEAARLVADAGALLDINMGCPVKKVIRSGAGSALLRSPERVKRIIGTVRRAYSGPLTIKIRSGWDEESINFLTIGRIAEAEGADALTLHPRTRSQAFAGQAHWELIGELKNTVNIPVFGSGDITTPEEARKMLWDTGCDAVMIGRGGYGNPWLIEQINQLLADQPVLQPDVTEKLRVALLHLQYHQDMFGDRKTVLDMRKHLCWYARGLQGASQFRKELQQSDCLTNVIRLTEAFFTQTEEAA